jgi:hypothetical protein
MRKTMTQEERHLHEDIQLQRVLTQDRMEHTAAYIKRGRGLESAGDQELRQLWLAALNIWCQDLDQKPPGDLEDAEAEMGLRGIDLPEVPPEPKAIMDAAVLRDRDNADAFSAVQARIAELRSREGGSH